MRRRTHVFDRRISENVFASDVALRMAVLAGLGGRDAEEFARLAFEDCVAAFAQRGGLSGICVGGLGVACDVDGVFLVFGKIGCHDDDVWLVVNWCLVLIWLYCKCFGGFLRSEGEVSLRLIC